VWGYAIAWALVNDRLKLAAYWVLDRADKKAKQNRSPTASGHPSEGQVQEAHSA
jgi:hypothetical protein